MTTAKDIESELTVDTDGVIARESRKEFYALGFAADELPDDVLGFSPVADPQLETS